ncbi:uncharacterized protein EDB91DRAFT_1333398 [Suillus paluster]|uniref:uncharacterized protein n=1 Tax=Suillus paluster TaxID=48578 RepID=UPI001B85B7AF|nr:uncharacterized protein EDB91DRAFT_1333398 [Suillus paluster]KAG1752403.1 hypothetical protein EDB91DRAFT_1333398 [Suillus paluster]
MAQGPSQTNPCQNSRSMPPLSTAQPGQSLTTALVTFTARLNHLSTWWPVRAGHTSPPNVDVPFAWGDLRHAAAGAPSHIDDDLIRDEDYVPPSPTQNSQPLHTGGNNTGEHGSDESTALDLPPMKPESDSIIDTSQVEGNASSAVKHALLSSLQSMKTSHVSRLTGKPFRGFEAEFTSRLQLTEVSVLPKAEEPEKLE